MGMRGKRPAPTELRLLRGERRPSRINYEQPALPAPTDLEPPRDLTGEGLAEWKALVPTLVESGHLCVTDIGAFADFCRGISMLRRFERKAAKISPEKAIAAGLAGSIIKLRTQLLAQRRDLGLSPTSRVSVKGAGKRKSSAALERFFERRAAR